MDYNENYEDEECEILDCPKCGREYDEIDADYLICSYCGWNVEEQKFNDSITKEDDWL